MVKVNNSLKVFISCYLVLLQVYTGWCQTLAGSVVHIRQNTNYLCGGVAVRNTLVITAAHCLPNGATTPNVLVYYGPAPGTRIDVTRIVVDPLYVADTRVNDVAALLLASPLPNTVPIAPLCGQSYVDNARIYVYAWSLPTTDAGATTTLNTLSFNIYRRDWCAMKYPTRVNVGHTRMFCGFDPQTTQQPCFRDRGGPVEYNGQFCGIMSFAFLCTDSTRPGVFTDAGTNGVLSFIQTQVTSLV